MKLPKIETGSVQSMGRANLGAVGQVASATAGVANARSQLFNTIGQVALNEGARQKKVAEEKLNQGVRIAEEFKKREDDYLLNSAVTSTALEVDEFIETNSVKDTYTTEEIEGIPEDAVRRTTKSSLDNGDEVEINRKDIPSYQVYPYLLKNKLEAVIKQKAETITNPTLRQKYLDTANVGASKLLKEAMIASVKKQKVYMKETAKDDSLQLSINGRLSDSINAIKAGGFDPREEKKLIQNRKEVFEWEQDTRILNTNNLPAMQARYDHLKSAEYGKGKSDYLGPGKASGKFNVRANLKRFKSYMTTTKGKVDLANYRQTEEYIRALGNGNDENNPLTEPAGGYKEYIEALGYDENKTDMLLRKASVAYSEGRGRNMTLNTTFAEDDSLIDEHVRILSESDAEYNDEGEATLKGINEAAKYKEVELREDANNYLRRHNPSVQAAQEKYENEKDLSLKKVAFNEYLITSRAEQERYGLLHNEVNFLSKQDIKEFVALTEKASALGAQQLIDQSDAMRDSFGQEWPAVYSQLIREGVLKPEHIVSNNIENPALRIMYVDSMRRQEYLMKTQTYKDNITDVRRDAENAIRTFKATSITPGAFPNAAKGLSVDDQYTALTNGIVQIMMARIDASGKYNKEEVVELVNKITQDKWVTEGNVRVPRTKIVNGKTVKQNTDQIVRALKLLRSNSSVSPDLKFYSRPVQGVSPADQQAILREDFKNFSLPVTNGDETGVLFKYASGDPVYVIRNGRAVPLEMSFDELELAGKLDFRESVTGGKRSVIEGRVLIK